MIIISWASSWRPAASTLAHEVGHALGLEDLYLADQVADNLMNQSLSEWKSRLSVGQLFIMNFGGESWAVSSLNNLGRPLRCSSTECPLWNVGVGQ